MHTDNLFLKFGDLCLQCGIFVCQPLGLQLWPGRDSADTDRLKK